ncbi:MAG: MBL fold metallo-hydrolase [Thermotogota bacterium]|nr:MBL fold metallo-hydrolase [Thermotogota bacterium]
MFIFLKGKMVIYSDGGQNSTKVDKQIKNNKIPWNDIKFIMITHHHSVHVNALGQILGRTDAKIIIHNYEVKPLETGFLDRKIFPLNRRIKLLMGMISLSILKKIKLRTKDVILKSDSDFLRNHGINGTILETPGHTLGSLSLLMDNGNAYIGDAAMNFMKFLGLRKRPMIAEDYEKVFESWRKLLNSGAKELYPSHGASFSAEELSKRLTEFNNN